LGGTTNPKKVNLIYCANGTLKRRVNGGDRHRFVDDKMGEQAVHFSKSGL